MGARRWVRTPPTVSARCFYRRTGFFEVVIGAALQHWVFWATQFPPPKPLCLFVCYEVRTDRNGPFPLSPVICYFAHSAPAILPNSMAYRITFCCFALLNRLDIADKDRPSIQPWLCYIRNLC
jgi:hypothetical protein